MKPDAKGNKLWKRVTVKVIVGDKTMHHQFVAPAQRGYSESDIEEMRGEIVDYIDKKFPLVEFKEVQLLPNAFNYIAVGGKDERRTGASIKDVFHSEASVREARPSNLDAPRAERSQAK